MSAPASTPTFRCSCGAALGLGGTPEWMAPTLRALWAAAHAGEGHESVEETKEEA